jgi:hypothetical protein
MSGLFKEWIRAFFRFLMVKSRRRLLLLGMAGIIALIEFVTLGLVRRTFVFYAVDGGKMIVEDRMVKRSSSREIDITRYVEETLLGPVSPDCLPLFPRETRLRSLLYRDEVVYADFSEDALLPPGQGGEVLGNFATLYAGIRRNFPFVRDIRFFIAGKTAYYEEFRERGEKRKKDV